VKLVMASKAPKCDPIAVISVFYNGDDEEGRKWYARMIALVPVANGVRMMLRELKYNSESLSPIWRKLHAPGT
jgi:hypothetical protein